MSVILNALRAKEAAKAGGYSRKPPSMSLFIADDEPRTQVNVVRMSALIVVLFASMIFAGFRVSALLFSSSNAGLPVQPKLPAVALVAPKVETTVTKEQAKALFDDGQIEEALAAYEKLAKANPKDAMILSDMGLILLKEDRLLAAETNLRDAIKLDPSCAECYNNLGLLATQKGRAVEAERHFTKAMDLKEDYADPYFNLAVLLEKNGDEAGAIAHFEDFLRHTSNKNSSVALQVKKHLAKLNS